jgi:hypothetical protein
MFARRHIPRPCQGKICACHRSLPRIFPLNRKLCTAATATTTESSTLTSPKPSAKIAIYIVDLRASLSTTSNGIYVPVPEHDTNARVIEVGHLIIVPAMWHYPRQARGKDDFIIPARGNGNLAFMCGHDLFDHVEA